MRSWIQWLGLAVAAFLIVTTVSVPAAKAMNGNGTRVVEQPLAAKDKDDDDSFDDEEGDDSTDASEQEIGPDG